MKYTVRKIEEYTIEAEDMDEARKEFKYEQPIKEIIQVEEQL